MISYLQSMMPEKFISKKLRIRFYKKLSLLLKSGESITDALFELIERAKEDNNTAEVIMLRDIHQKMKEGRSPGEAFSRWVTDAEMILLESGSRTQLFGPLKHCQTLLEKEIVIQSCVRKAIAYPLYQLMLILGLVLFTGRVVLPKFAETLPPEAWTGAGALIYQIYRFANSYSFFVFIAGLLLFIAWIAWSMPNLTGSTRRLLDNLPPWSIYRIQVGTSWLFSLATMMQSNLSLTEGLQKTRETALGRNEWLTERLTATLLQIKGGGNLGEALKRSGYNFPDKETVSDLVVFARQKNFEKILTETAAELTDDNVAKITTQSEVFNQCFGLLIVFLYAGFLFGIMSIQSQFANSISGGF